MAWKHPCCHRRDCGAGELQPRLPKQFLQTEAGPCLAGLCVTPMVLPRNMASRVAIVLKMPLAVAVCRALVPAWVLQRTSECASGVQVLHRALRNHYGAGHVAKGLQVFQ